MKPFFLNTVRSQKDRLLYQQYLDYRERCDIVAAVNPIHLSSENRDRKLYPSATDFILSLPRTYRDVKSILISQIEFPSANYTLKRNNVEIRWLEDGYDQNNKGVAQVSPGSYTTDSLVIELISALNRSKSSLDRKMLWKYKYIDNLAGGVKIYVYGRSRKLQKNPLITTADSKFVTIIYPDHSFTVEDTVLLSGITGSPGGLTSDLWNGIEYPVVEIPDKDSFVIKCPGAEPYLDDIAGGDTVLLSSMIPFAFLGKNPVLDMLGFPPCTSSLPLDIPLSQWLKIDETSEIPLENDKGSSSSDSLAKLQIGDLFSIIGLNWDNETMYKIIGGGGGGGTNKTKKLQRLSEAPSRRVSDNDNFPLENRLRISCIPRKIGFRLIQSNAFDTGTLYRAPNLLGDTHCFIYLNEKILGKIQFTQISGYLAFNNASDQALQFKNGSRPDLSTLKLSLKDKDNRPLYLAGLEYSLSLVITENEPQITEYPLREYLKKIE